MQDMNRNNHNHNDVNAFSSRTRNSLRNINIEEIEPAATEEDEVQLNNKQSKRCAKFSHLMDTYPITFVLSGAAIGIGIGIALAIGWQPEDSTQKDTVILWIGLVGELFIRALKCIVVPLVFVSIAVSFMDMLALGKAGKIVGFTIGLYVFTTICASLIGVLCSFIFKQFYIVDDGGGENEYPIDVRIGCSVDTVSNNIDTFLTEEDDGSVVCSSFDDNSDTSSTLFRIEDVNGYFQAATDKVVKLSLSEVSVSFEWYVNVISRIFSYLTSPQIYTNSLYIRDCLCSLSTITWLAYL